MLQSDSQRYPHASSGDAKDAKDYLEVQKVVFDYLKHLITLDTGSILLMVALLDKVFQKPQWRWLIVLSFISFLLSVMLLSISAFGVVRSIRTPKVISSGLKTFTATTFIAGLLGFLTGLISLAAWAVRNWL